MVLVLAVALVVFMGARRTLSSPEPPSSQIPDSAAALVPEATAVPMSPEDDLRLLAFLEVYDSLIDSVRFTHGDAVLFVHDQPIFFQDGRMLSEDHRRDPEPFDPTFYRYSLRPLSEPPPVTGDPAYSTDLMEAFFGRTETQIRRQGRSASFLDHGVFMNSFSLDALAAVEADLRAEAVVDPLLATWISEIEVAYSFIDREISGSDRRSYHAWGLAIDLVPASYEGKHVYWRWSRVFNSEGWHQIPVSRRWSPPQAVIEAFERHGFVWGGKWSHFDTIHFEYRPEIVLYNQMIERGNSAQPTR